ncbi:MAG: hypothetical protein PUB49_01635 [Selenomonadaceae bacterium]|nr:hypothetical protein [Selenomonadaceae bacterium]
MPLLAAILYDSRTHTTEKAAAFIAEGVQRAGLTSARFRGLLTWMCGGGVM